MAPILKPPQPPNTPDDQAVCRAAMAWCRAKAIPPEECAVELSDGRAWPLVPWSFGPFAHLFSHCMKDSILAEPEADAPTIVTAR